MKRIAKLTLYVFISIWSSKTTSAQGITHRPLGLPLIPYPQEVTQGRGSYVFPLKKVDYLVDDSVFFSNEIAYLRQLFPNRAVYHAVNRSKAELVLKRDQSIAEDAYQLKIGGDGVVLSASTPKGMFSALQTLRQLLPIGGNQISLPFLAIKDYPSYEWRGMELDVARHFFSKEYLLKFIDLLALYKFNKLHLHLTDDQGWRLEIKKYPKLVEQGAWRRFNNQDSACIAKSKDNPNFAIEPEHIRMRDGQEEYGGYYSQEDMKEIIAYAMSRHVEIIPEIDMPGHMMVATQAYPELTDGVEAGWGKQFSVPICPCKEETFDFVEGVLQEVTDLFPSKYIHIGADEVEKSTWAQSDKCKLLMQKEGMTDLHDLQSYFVNRVNRFIQSRGKRTIAWDEVLDGGADSSITVMYWRGWVKDAPLKAVTANHEVIMTPTNPLYFDYLPNKSTLSSVYHLKVVADDIPLTLSGQIKGAQANVWTEMIPSRARLEFMILPRMTALAERVWTEKALYESYQRRLLLHYPMWDAMGIKYRLPDLSGFTDRQVLIDGSADLKVINPLESAQVYYTMDGSIPTQASQVMDGKIKIDRPLKVRFATISSKGAKSELYEVEYRAATWKKAVQNLGYRPKPGLKASLYGGSFASTKAMTGEVVRTMVLPNVHLDDTIKLPAFGARIRGYLRVPHKDIYSFYFTCDDGGVLEIAGELVVDNDGQHSAVEKSGQIALDKGYHAFSVDFIEAGGGFALKLAYSVNGGEVKQVPDSWFYHED
ncbi:family 20 glycosylhydrolase [Olivibacter sitiensis]|uniref:family 20 glycosylhydrolase n=1 Tax=Olivibacter sitiensis TaxID=376470 RepID=UPI000483EB34|nr:family 20 glycosylhydrolase [Olivibacter sitiensis]